MKARSKRPGPKRKRAGSHPPAKAKTKSAKSAAVPRKFEAVRKPQKPIAPRKKAQMTEAHDSPAVASANVVAFPSKPPELQAEVSAPTVPTSSAHQTEDQSSVGGADTNPRQMNQDDYDELNAFKSSSALPLKQLMLAQWEIWNGMMSFYQRAWRYPPSHHN